MIDLHIIRKITGLRADKDSLEYKESVIYLQRMGAPAAAIAIPSIIFLALTVMVVTTGIEQPEKIDVFVAQEIEAVELEEIPPPEDVPPPETDLISDINFESPNNAMIGEVVPEQPVALNPPVQLSPSPVYIKGISSRGSGGGGLGFSTRIAGDMIGTLYDFKRDASGKNRTWDYWKDVKSIVSTGCISDSFKPFYKVPKKVYLPFLYVPNMPAEAGPDAFGVKGLMEARGWMAHYVGEIQPEESGEYRFAGCFDDLLIVMINGKVVLDGSWLSGSESGSDWKSTSNESGKYDCFIPRKLVYSNWITFDANKKDSIDLIVGERPGGKIGGVLLVEKKGVEYKKAANGRPILPLFATSRLSFKDKDILSKNSWQIETDAPRMNIAGRKTATAIFADSIKIDSGDL